MRKCFWGMSDIGFDYCQKSFTAILEYLGSMYIRLPTSKQEGQQELVSQFYDFHGFPQSNS